MARNENETVGNEDEILSWVEERSKAKQQWLHSLHGLARLRHKANMNDNDSIELDREYLGNFINLRVMDPL